MRFPRRNAGAWDFSDSMKLIAQTAFPNARISLDRFHVFQDLNRYFMKAFSGVRDKVLVAIKHEKAAYDRKVERCAKNRKAYRVRHPKRHKGRKRGRKAKWRKKGFKPSTMKNGESKMDFLRRSFYTLRTSVPTNGATSSGSGWTSSSRSFLN